MHLKNRIEHAIQYCFQDDVFATWHSERDSLEITWDYKPNTGTGYRSTNS